MYQRICLLTEEIETNQLDTGLMKLMKLYKQIEQSDAI